MGDVFWRGTAFEKFPRGGDLAFRHASFPAADPSQFPCRGQTGTGPLGNELTLHLRIELDLTEKLAACGELPNASVTQDGLKITQLDNEVPDAAEVLKGKAFALLPHVKLTDSLLEVDRWTNFTDHFGHLIPTARHRTAPCCSPADTASPPAQ